MSSKRYERKLAAAIKQNIFRVTRGAVSDAWPRWTVIQQYAIGETAPAGLGRVDAYSSNLKIRVMEITEAPYRLNRARVFSDTRGHASLSDCGIERNLVRRRAGL